MNRHHTQPRRTLLLRCAVVLITLVSLVFIGAPASASASNDGDRSPLTVMTRNLYLGADLTPALKPGLDAQQFLLAVAGIYATAQYTNFPVRAKALAAEIEANKLDLIGLQEVSEWVTSGPGVPPTVPTTVDFLAELTSALAAEGLSYKVAAVSDNANIGPVPLVALPPGLGDGSACAAAVGACTVTLKDRDVILVNDKRDGLWWNNPRHGNYTAQQTFTPPLPGAPPVSFNRGWATIDGWLNGRPFHFANTHLETEDFAAVQLAQSREFLYGPAFGRGADIAVGDFNSAADGSTTRTYAKLTRVFDDAWQVNRGQPGFTCCQNERLTNEDSELKTRIDLVLTRYGAKAIEAHLVGDTPFEDAPPLWASDHAGVVATLRLDSWW